MVIQSTDIFHKILLVKISNSSSMESHPLVLRNYLEWISTFPDIGFNFLMGCRLIWVVAFLSRGVPLSWMPEYTFRPVWSSHSTHLRHYQLFQINLTFLCLKMSSLLSIELNLNESYLESYLQSLSETFLSCFNSASQLVGSLALKSANESIPEMKLTSNLVKPQKRPSSSLKLDNPKISPVVPPKKAHIPVKPKAPNPGVISGAPTQRMFNELFNAEGQRFFMCIHCTYSCNAKSSINRHAELMHNPDAKKYRCTMCPVEAKFGWRLKDHYMKVHHLSETVAKAAAAEAWKKPCGLLVK